MGNLSASFVLGWIGELADENGGGILGALRGDERDIEFVFLIEDSKTKAIQIDHPVIEFRKEGTFVNNELFPGRGR